MNHKKDQADSRFLNCQGNVNKKWQPEQQKWSNNLMSLHKVLSNLENDNLKRYNNETNQFSQQNYKKNNIKTQKISCKNYQDYESKTPFKFVIQPQPWFNENEISRLKKTKNISCASKSFHLTLPKYFQNQKFSNRNYRSSSTIDPSNLSTLRDVESIKLRAAQSNDKFLTQTFNYTNQQKAKVSIVHLAHEKQHKKIEKILKYKAHYIDKNSLKQQKIKQHSQFLIEALKNLSFDDLIPNRKKSSLKIEGNKRVRTHSEQQKSQNNHLKSISCGKLQTLNQNIPMLTYFPDQVKYSVKRLEPEIIKVDLPKKDKQNYKVSFKPKRNWIFERNAISQKNLNQNCQNEAKKYRSRVENISSHFLKINKIQK